MNAGILFVSSQLNLCDSFAYFVSKQWEYFAQNSAERHVDSNSGNNFSVFPNIVNNRSPVNTLAANFCATALRCALLPIMQQKFT
jgi:hypothetical protein